MPKRIKKKSSRIDSLDSLGFTMSSKGERAAEFIQAEVNERLQKLGLTNLDHDNLSENEAKVVDDVWQDVTADPELEQRFMSRLAQGGFD